MSRVRSVFFAVSVAAFASGLAACSWSRFGKLTDEGPVLLVDKPPNVTGIGPSMLAFKEGSLLVQRVESGSSLLLYAFGQSEDPNKGGVAIGAVQEDPSGGAAVDSVALNDVVGIDDYGGSLCFAGSMSRTDTTDAASYNLVVACLNDATRVNALSFPNVDAFPIPSAFNPAGFAIFGNVTTRRYPNALSLASAKGFLVAGSPDAGLVWVHPVPAMASDSAVAIAQLPTPAGADASYGWSVAAIAKTDGSVTIAASSPTAGLVFVTDIAATGVQTPRGCISGAAGSYGVTLHGYLDGTRRLLAISDAASKVDVIDVDQITDGGACAAASGSQIVAALTCADGADASGCDGGRFGFSIANGDLDGDGDQELIVGAPGMNVRDRGNAGAVYTYDLEGKTNPTDVYFESYPSGADLIGKTVGALHEADHDVVVSTAEGRDQLAIFYCTNLGGKGAGSERCP